MIQLLAAIVSALLALLSLSALIASWEAGLSASPADLLAGTLMSVFGTLAVRHFRTWLMDRPLPRLPRAPDA